MRSIKYNTTGVTTTFYFTDQFGYPLSGMAYNSPGLRCSYLRERSADVEIGLTSITTTSPYSSGGFIEIDPVFMPGSYRFDIPDVAFVSGSNFCVIHFTTPSGVIAPYEIPIVGYNDQILPVNMVQYLGNDCPDADISGHPKVTINHSGSIESNGRGGRLWYIDNSGQSANPGTKMFPRKFLANTFASCKDNDTIIVNNGNYDISAGTFLRRSNIELLGQSSTGVVINYTYDSTNPAAINVFGNNVKIKSLTINTINEGYGILTKSANNISIEDCILNVPNIGINLIQTVFSDIHNTNHIVRGNIIDSKEIGIYTSNVAGLFCENNNIKIDGSYENIPSTEIMGINAIGSQGDILNNRIRVIVPNTGIVAYPHKTLGISSYGSSLEIKNNKIIVSASLAGYTGTIIGYSANALANSVETYESLFKNNSLYISGSNATLLDITGMANNVNVIVLGKNINPNRIGGNVYLLTNNIIDTNNNVSGMPNAILNYPSGIESNYSLRDSTRLILSSVVGELSGADAGNTIYIRDINNTKNRIVATVTPSGNRTNIITDVT